MRFPETIFMKRLFDLAKNRNLRVKLIPYIMQMIPPSPNTFLFYNNNRVNNQDPNLTDDPFHVSAYLTDTNLKSPQGVSAAVTKVLKPFRDLFLARSGERPNIATAMSKLFEETDGFSMRGYMSEISGMSGRDISWCETLDKSTGWYDRALTESA